MPSDFNRVRQVEGMEHTDLMNSSLSRTSRERGCKVCSLSARTLSRMESSPLRSHGDRRQAGCDREVHRDGRTVIYDAKTGQAVGTSHIVAGAALHVSAAEIAQDWPLEAAEDSEGAVVYADGSRRGASHADSIDDGVRLASGGVHAEDDLGHAAPPCA